MGLRLLCLCGLWVFVGEFAVRWCDWCDAAALCVVCCFRLWIVAAEWFDCGVWWLQGYYCSLLAWVLLLVGVFDLIGLWRVVSCLLEWVWVCGLCCMQYVLISGWQRFGFGWLLGLLLCG